MRLHILILKILCWKFESLNLNFHAKAKNSFYKKIHILFAFCGSVFYFSFLAEQLSYFVMPNRIHTQWSKIAKPIVCHCLFGKNKNCALASENLPCVIRNLDARLWVISQSEPRRIQRWHTIVRDRFVSCLHHHRK